MAKWITMGASALDTILKVPHLPKADEIGLDMSTDTYDAGAHLNVYGAEKMTRYFGSLLCEKHGYEASVPATGSDQAWDARVARYYEQKTRLEQETKKEKTT